jgi:hypothetical protein
MHLLFAGLILTPCILPVTYLIDMKQQVLINRFLVTISLVGLLVTTGCAQHNVGYQSYSFSDSLEMHLWYPSSNGSVGSYQNYLQNVSVKHLSTQVAPNINDYLNAYLSGFIFGKQIDLSKITNIPALNNSKQVSQRRKYPLVIYAPGYRGLPFENSLLCEQLAQAGYVVASIPSLGVRYKIDSMGCEVQANYIAKAIEFSKQNFHFVDQNSIHLIGFSWGGLSSIIAATRSTSIKSVVSLDGSIRFFYSVAEKMPGFNPSEFNKPVLLFSAEGNDEVDFKFFDKLNKVPAYLIKMKGFNHLDFMSYRYLETPYQDTTKIADYRKMLETIRLFLKAVDKNSMISKEAVKTMMLPNKLYAKP